MEYEASRARCLLADLAAVWESGKREERWRLSGGAERRSYDRIGRKFREVSHEIASWDARAW